MRTLLGTVYSVEISTLKKSLSVEITFGVEDINILIDDIVMIEYLGEPKYFKVIDIKATTKRYLTVTAIEYGYWRTKLNSLKDLDIRLIVSSDVMLVSNEEVLELIHKQANLYS